MDPTKTFKRLGSIGLVTGVLASLAPFVGATAANATAGVVHFVDPCNSFSCGGGYTFSNASNGTNSGVHLYAAIKQATSPNPLLVSVAFKAHDDTADPGNLQPPTTIATSPVVQDTTGLPAEASFGGTNAMATAVWHPAVAGDQYTLSADALDANNATVPASETGVGIASDSNHTVTISRPHDGGFIGYYATTGKYNETGTATANGDPVTGAIDVNTALAPVTFDGTSQRWAIDLGAGVNVPTGPTGDTPGTEINLGGVAAVQHRAFPDQTEEIDRGVAYLQRFADSPNGYTMTPSSGFACQAVGASPAPTPAGCVGGVGSTPYQVYAFKATDQKGNPISGVPVSLTLTDPGGAANSLAYETPLVTASTPPASANANWTAPTTVPLGSTTISLPTNVFGVSFLRVYDTDQETSNIEAKTKFNGVAYVNGTDYDLTGTFSTSAQVPTSGTATVVGNPTAPIYATQEYGINSGIGPDGNPTPTPTVKVNVKDSHGNPIPGAAVQYSYVHTVTGGANTSGCSDPNSSGSSYTLTVPSNPATASLTSATTSNGNGDLYIVPTAVTADQSNYTHASSRCAQTESGNDVFNVYINNNGLPGFQTGDTVIGTVTIPFGPESIYFQPCDQISKFQGGADPFAAATDQTCASQQKAGVDKTLTFVASIWDGTTRQPIANRKLDIILTGAGTAGTDFGFSSSNNTGLTKLTASTGNVATDATGMGTVTVFSNTVQTLGVTASDPTLGALTSDDAVNNVAFRTYSAVLNGLGGLGGYNTGQVSPLNSGSSVGAPGQPLIQCQQFLDQNSAPLANEVFKVATTAGFLTDLPNAFNSRDFTKLHFDTAAADGQPVLGDLHPNGSSGNFVTDALGRACFNLGILTASHFAIDGTVSGTVTAQLDGSGTSLAVDNNRVLFATDAQNYNVQALNAGPMSIVQGRFDNNGKFQVQTGAPSGQKATASDNTIPIDNVDTIVQQQDSFHNPISEPVNVTSTGNGVLGTLNATVWGSYDNIQNATTGFAFGNGYVLQNNDPAADNPATGDQTVTFTWNAAHTTWLVNTTLGTKAVNVTTNPVTGSYTVTWYVRDPAGFHYVTTMVPGSTEAPGTPITVSVTVTDNASPPRPVQGLGVEFIRSGPQGETQDTGNPATCNGNAANGCSNFLFTNVQGMAGFTFDSTKSGPFRITTIVTDFSGNEIGRSVSNGELTGGHLAQVTIHSKRLSYLKGTRHRLHGAAPAGHDVHVYRGGRLVATVLADNTGHWHVTLRFNRTSRYFARSAGLRSPTITIRVHR